MRHMIPLKALSMTVAMAGLLLASSFCAADKPEQFVRNAGRLSQLQKIALMPTVVEVKFDERKVPDPDQMMVRQTVASCIAAMLEKQMESGPYQLLPSEFVIQALQDKKWSMTDLYVTHSTGTWDRPAEVRKNARGDEAVLLSKYTEFVGSPTAVSPFRYQWCNTKEPAFGLATTSYQRFPKIDKGKARALAAELGADALLYCQVANLEVTKGTVVFENFKSTRVQLVCTLISPEDGAILWQARIRGVHSQKAGFFTGATAYPSDRSMAVDATNEALKYLLQDLYKGNGKPVKSDTRS